MISGPPSIYQANYTTVLQRLTGLTPFEGVRVDRHDIRIHTEMHTVVLKLYTGYIQSCAYSAFWCLAPWFNPVQGGIFWLLYMNGTYQGRRTCSHHRANTHTNTKTITEMLAVEKVKQLPSWQLAWGCGGTSVPGFPNSPIWRCGGATPNYTPPQSCTHLPGASTVASVTK